MSKLQYFMIRTDSGVEEGHVRLTEKDGTEYYAPVLSVEVTGLEDVSVIEELNKQFKSMIYYAR